MENQVQPLLSVVIPVYDSEKYLPSCLDSIIAQTYRNLEVIVVDNGSSGNVKEIYKEYKDENSEFRWQFLHMEENIGLFHARIRGFEKANGKYFTTIDSDDRISIDFYYQLVAKALETGADVVAGGYVHDFVGDCMKNKPMNDFDLCNFCWEGWEILDRYMDACGRSFNYHALWCKIYSIEIFKRSQKALGEITEPIVLCEDILTTGIFMGNAQKFVNVHDVYYYHAVHTDAATNIRKDIQKIKSGFENTAYAFSCLKDYLISISRYEIYAERLEESRRKFSSILFTQVCESASLPGMQKRLIQQGCECLGLEKPVFSSPEVWLFECRDSCFSNDLDAALLQISSPDIQVVSFDIFDTLVERPFAKPDDTFEFLSMKFNEYKGNTKHIDFARLRRLAERTAREKVKQENPFFNEVNLTEIYAELVEMGVLNSQEAKTFLQMEIELEYRFCKPRRIGKYLFDFALRAGKTVICISDMYLSAAVIEEILRRCGYHGISKLYVSSEERVCKYDGALFRKALKDLNLKPQAVCHIGDNYISDYCAPQKCGMKFLYLASASEMFKGRNGLCYSGQSFPRIVGDENDPTGPYGYLGTRCLYGVASQKAFGNPFTHFDESSDFNSNPNVIGTYLLGTYAFTVAKWLLEETRKKGYDTVHFIARDGFLIKKAYDILAAHSTESAPASHYLYVSREALMPMMVRTKADLFALISLIDYKNYTPLSFLELMEKAIPENVYAAHEEILKQGGLLPDQAFETEAQWYQFIELYAEKFYSQEAVERYAERLRPTFAKLIGPHDCTFDAGYSVRTETLLYELLGCRLDAFYLYANEERAFCQAEQSGINLHTFHPEPASVSDILITEHLLCSTGGSCCGYQIRGDELEYLFAEPNVDRETAFLIDLVQERAEALVLDFVETFPEWESLCYRFAEKPFLYYVRHAKDFDKGIFFRLKNKDSNSSFAQDRKMIDIWQTTPCETFQVQIIDNTVGVKGSLVRYFKKRLPLWMHPFAKKIKHLLKW